MDVAGKRPLRRALLLLAALGMAATGAPPAALADDPVDPFVGTYVGSATTYDADGTVEDQRDIDMTIAKGQRGALTISWVAVTLVDGRRDVPGVDRDEVSLTLVPTDRPGVYIEETRTSLFERRALPDPLQGDPIRWAAIDGDRMGVYSMVIYDDGRYELQAYTRTLTEIGLDIGFRRIDDGIVVRRVEGRAVRVD